MTRTEAEIRAEIKRMWQSLLDKDDRNSPADYPDMAMLTFDEFSGYVNHVLEWALNPDKPQPKTHEQRLDNARWG